MEEWTKIFWRVEQIFKIIWENEGKKKNKNCGKECEQMKWLG